jgi:hypothetical protein
MLDTLKVIAATATIIGIISGFLERWYAPDTLITEQSPNYPAFLKWIGWLLASVGALAYIVIDHIGRG